jgi:hypothetical protein
MSHFAFLFAFPVAFFEALPQACNVSTAHATKR